MSYLGPRYTPPPREPKRDKLADFARLVGLGLSVTDAVMSRRDAKADRVIAADDRVDKRKNEALERARLATEAREREIDRNINRSEGGYVPRGLSEPNAEDISKMVADRLAGGSPTAHWQNEPAGDYVKTGESSSERAARLQSEGRLAEAQTLRTHQTTIEGTRQGNELAQISARGAEDRRTLGARVAAGLVDRGDHSGGGGTDDGAITRAIADRRFAEEARDRLINRGGPKRGDLELQSEFETRAGPARAAFTRDSTAAERRVDDAFGREGSLRGFVPPGARARTETPAGGRQDPRGSALDELEGNLSRDLPKTLEQRTRELRAQGVSKIEAERRLMEEGLLPVRSGR